MRRPHARSFRVADIVDYGKGKRASMEPIHNHLFHHARSAKSKQFAYVTTKPNIFVRVLIAVVLVIAVVSCYSFFHAHWEHPQLRYGIVIDGGSTGSRIHVIEYRILPGSKIDIVDRASLRANPGLSAYASHPEEAGESLNELLKFGRSRVPEEQWADTEVRLMATAGLRLLDPGIQERIIEECRRVLRFSGFKFMDEWASVISGSDEGLYAWIVANYALGTLGAEPSQTTGIVELGGASVQITFVAREPLPSEFSRTVLFGNVTYNIYSHSFLHFGQNVAFDAVRESLSSIEHRSVPDMFVEGTVINPCIPKGYLFASKSSPVQQTAERGSTVQPLGNFSQCRSAALALLQKDKGQCPYIHCSIGSTFIPKLEGKFLATENFFYTSKFFGLDSKAILSKFVTVGQEFCGQEWSSLKRKNKLILLDDEDLMHYCFSSAYIVALLHDSLGIALDDERIEYVNEVGNVPLDWAFGAFIFHSSTHPPIQHTSWVTRIHHSARIFAVVGIFIFFTLLIWSIFKLKKPGLKTIYDLEKGRYIVTRIIRRT